jgi:hypothetical protein
MSEQQQPDAPRQPIPWREKQAAYEAKRAAWDQGQRLVEEERIAKFGRGK